MDKDQRLREKFSSHFDLAPLYGRELRRNILFNYIQDSLERVDSINDCNEFIEKRENAVNNFIGGYEKAKKLNSHKKGFKTLLSERKNLRDCYGDYWSFDFSIKNHKLVDRCSRKLLALVDNDPKEFAILASPGKYRCKEGEFNLVNHVQKTYLIHRVSKKSPEIIKLCEFLDYVVYAEGKQDWELRKYFFDYALFGLNLLRNMQLRGLYKGKDPLFWLNNLWFEENGKK